MGKKSTAPATPDYAAAAQATAAGNRVNQVTPYGSLTYSQDQGQVPDLQAYQQALQAWNNAQGRGAPTAPGHQGGVGTGWGINPTSNAPGAPQQSQFMKADPNAPYTATTTLSPAEQQLYDQNTQLQTGLMGLANAGLGYAQNAMNNPVTMANLPASQVNPGQTGQDALMARFQPMMDQSNKALDQKLANQGIMPGSEAYTNAWRTQDQGNNDLMSQAALNGISVGENAQNQQFQLQNQLQMQPINLINALRSGNQVQAPQFTSTPAGPDYTGAAQNTYNANLGAYNAQQAGQNQLMGGLFGLGAASISSPYSLAAMFA